MGSENGQVVGHALRAARDAAPLRYLLPRAGSAMSEAALCDSLDDEQERRSRLLLFDEGSTVLAAGGRVPELL
jgi:hypothetical protein